MPESNQPELGVKAADIQAEAYRITRELMAVEAKRESHQNAIQEACKRLKSDLKKFDRQIEACKEDLRTVMSGQLPLSRLNG
jgi:hypothetical protein